MSLRRVPLKDVVVGAVLGEDVVDDAGRVLLRCGARVGELTLAGLRRRGVESLAIEVFEVADAEHQSAHRLVVEQELRVRFRRAGAGVATRLLFQATLEHLLEKQA